MVGRGSAKSKGLSSARGNGGGRGGSKKALQLINEQPSRMFSEDASDYDEEPSNAETQTNPSNSARVQEEQAEIHLMSGNGTEEGVSSTPSIPTNEMPIDPKAITIQDGCFVGNKPSHEITKIFKSFWPGPYPTWKLVEDEPKRHLWEKFQEKFSWSPDDTQLVRSAWNRTAADRYKGILCDARKAAKSDVGTDKMSETRNYKHEFIPEKDWENLVDNVWGKEEYELKCEKASKNRLSAKHGSVSTHTGGSINFTTHKKKMEQERKREVGRHEVYLRTHKKHKGNGAFVDSKSALVEEKYKELLVAKYGPEVVEKEDFDDVELWTKAVGGEEKGRLYGQGSIATFKPQSRISIVSSSADSSSSHESHAQFEERIRNEVREELKVELDKQVEEKLAAILDAKMKEQEDQMRKRDEERDEQMRERDEKIEALMKALNVHIR